MNEYTIKGDDIIKPEEPLKFWTDKDFLAGWIRDKRSVIFPTLYVERPKPKKDYVLVLIESKIK
jgi:hypothetical protein